MIKAKIEGGKETEYLEFPCEQETLNEKTDGGDEIKVTFSGESEFESKLISLIRPGESAFDHQLHLRVLREPAVGR